MSHMEFLPKVARTPTSVVWKHATVLVVFLECLLFKPLGVRIDILKFFFFWLIFVSIFFSCFCCGVFPWAEESWKQPAWSRAMPCEWDPKPIWEVWQRSSCICKCFGWGVPGLKAKAPPQKTSKCWRSVFFSCCRLWEACWRWRGIKNKLLVDKTLS